MFKLNQIVRAFIVISLGLFVPVLSVAGSLDPSAGPAPTMKTLDQMPPTWGQKLQCNTAACPRFELVLDGTGVLDKETGLVWEQSPSNAKQTWANAFVLCAQKEVGGREGWHLPTIEQLTSLVDNSAFPGGHPFIMPSGGYWSATTMDSNDGTMHFALVGNCNPNRYFNSGTVFNDDKQHTNYVWCVRGGQSHNSL